MRRFLLGTTFFQGFLSLYNKACNLAKFANIRKKMKATTVKRPVCLTFNYTFKRQNKKELFCFELCVNNNKTLR